MSNPSTQRNSDQLKTYAVTDADEWILLLDRFIINIAVPFIAVHTAYVCRTLHATTNSEANIILVLINLKLQQQNDRNGPMTTVIFPSSFVR